MTQTYDSYFRKYYQDHKEQIKEKTKDYRNNYNKKYYEKNREKLKLARLEKKIEGAKKLDKSMLKAMNKTQVTEL